MTFLDNVCEFIIPESSKANFDSFLEEYDQERETINFLSTCEQQFNLAKTIEVNDFLTSFFRRNYREYLSLSMFLIECFYTNINQRKRIGLRTNPPFPVGNVISCELDLNLLEPVYNKGQIYIQI